MAIETEKRDEILNNLIDNKGPCYRTEQNNIFIDVKSIYKGLLPK